MDSEFDDYDESLVEIKIIFIGIDKNPSQKLVDLYIQSIVSAPTTSAADGDDIKPCITDVKGVQTKLTLTCSDGKDKYRSLTTTYFKNASKVFLTYSLTNGDSVRTLQSWLKEIQRYCDPDVDVGILGFGIESEENKEIFNSGKSFADENRFDHYLVNLNDKDNAIQFLKAMIEKHVPIEQKTEQTPFPEKKSGCCVLL
ncbi:hypothetical protein ENUP19_0305G0098 [Entamoeba nuttalli]|uniref:Ras family protein n=2 Tax=Entamoeba nuttalli TaxID=412467 RepID=K2GDG9_ENTNP|nr:Ras family protein [Entamoeba nuttalli P19]EKE40591.1 Ras family protein [Entamoeba nuttalli P19]|eukprot:XP_008857067.1 Ras family protein [Entamoeba nuttalli P19]